MDDETKPQPPVPGPAIDGEPEPGGSFSAATGVLSAFFFGLLNWVIIPIAIVFVLHNFVFQAFHVVGSSMVPTLKDADYLIVSKIDKSIAGVEHKAYIPTRYQIIVFHYPRDPSLVFVKRVIGLPGERITVKGGVVTVYNAQSPGGFTPDTNNFERADTTTLGEIDEVVPEGQIFVLGDNRTPNGSFDSREWGNLPSSYIIGKAVLRLLPLDGFRLF